MSWVFKGRSIGIAFGRRSWRDDLRKERWCLAILVLLFCLDSTFGQFEFGSGEYSMSPRKPLIVEDFTSVPGLDQGSVNIVYLDIGIAPGLYDEGDALYLHIGPGPIRIADIRLTDSLFGLAGSKVGPTDRDFDMTPKYFAQPYPRLVYADLGGVINQYDPSDAVYVKVVPPMSGVAVGDVRLTEIGEYSPGTMVRNFDKDRGLMVGLLHPGPDFALWPPSARGKVRFYNANGNVFDDSLSIPLYDASDRVYFDISVPSDYPRLFGYVTCESPEPLQCSGSIGDFVWNDSNANGVQDEGEEGIPGMAVCLLDSCGEVIRNCVTDSGGRYLFKNLCAGDYRVCVNFSMVVYGDGVWIPTTPNVGGDDSRDSEGILIE